MKRVKKFKTGLVALMAALILGTAVGGTLAYIITKTDAKTNVFTPGEVKCEVLETFTQGSSTKNNVRVKNTGNTEAYIRVAVVANWCDASGNIVEPVLDFTTLSSTGTYNIDYTKDWFMGSDCYYYYKAPVAPGAETAIIFDKYTPGMNNDLHLEMNIIAQAIQSTPDSVVESVWPVEVGTDKLLSAKNN